VRDGGAQLHTVGLGRDFEHIGLTPLFLIFKGICLQKKKRPGDLSGIAANNPRTHKTATITSTTPLLFKTFSSLLFCFGSG
jgi:hypothetical protein